MQIRAFGVKQSSLGSQPFAGRSASHCDPQFGSQQPSSHEFGSQQPSSNDDLFL